MDFAQELAVEAGLSEADVNGVRDCGPSALKSRAVVIQGTVLTCRSLGKAESFFDGALANGRVKADREVHYVDGIGGIAASAAFGWAKDEEVQNEIDPEEGGWDLDVTAADVHSDQQERSEELQEATDFGAGARPGVKKTEPVGQQVSVPRRPFGSEMPVSLTTLTWKQPFHNDSDQNFTQLKNRPQEIVKFESIGWSTSSRHS